MKHRTHKAGIAERQMRERGIYNPDDFERWLEARGWSWQRLDRGDYGMSVENAVLLCTLEDPVLWAQAFLIEPETGEPYSLWDYQKTSIRSFLQDVVHEDGAEVGKTREITVLSLWSCITGMGGRIRKPSILVGAPMQVFLDDIARAIELQAGVADGAQWKSPLRDFWLEPIRTPHKLFRMKTINPMNPERPAVAEIHFRPAGHDGESFRGVHVNALAIMEEAAKCKNKVQWTEFYRGMMPGCRLRVYSVPDGDRNTEYHRLCSEAVEDLPAGEKGMRKFKWPKTLMPPPFWTEERRQYFVRLFGGADSAGYKRNVMGEWGDAENPVVRWDVLLPNVVDLPEYRKVVLGADGADGTLYSAAHRIELVMTEGRKSGQERCVSDRADELDDFIANNDGSRRAAWADLLAPHLAHIDPRGLHVVGGDLGERNDPTELVVSERIGEKLRDVLRIKAKGLPYHAQEELIYQVDKACGHQALWGLDLGSAGTAVVKNLLNRDAYADAGFEGRLIGFHFQESVDCIGEDGEALEQEQKDSHGNVRVVILRAPAKHWATLCIVQRLQQRGYQLAYDADVLNDYTSHTAREGTKWPIYAKKNDHTIDARRQQMLRLLQEQNEGGAVDVFSGSTYDRRAAA